MKKRVVFVHGWEGTPTGGWLLWLSKELRSRGFEVIGPQLPDADEPKIEKWVPVLADAVGVPDEQTYFVGHSMGCQTIARYLESLPEKTRVGGAVFVAGFFKRLTGIENEEGAEEIGRHWLGAPIDLKKVRARMERSIAVFSDNDPYVPLDNQDDFRDKLGSKVVIEKNMGHFTQGDGGVLELPVVLSSLLQIAE